MTPLQIEILLHCYYSPEPFPREAPAISEAFGILESSGLIYQRADRSHATTNKGSAHVQQLCNLPFPTQAWIGADGAVLSEEVSA